VIYYRSKKQEIFDFVQPNATIVNKCSELVALYWLYHNNISAFQEFQQ
jgi:hypothetical protein